MLDDLEPRVQSNVAAVIVWTKHFTPSERAALGDDNYLAWKDNGRTAGMWAAVRGGSRLRAILDIAYAQDWIATDVYRESLSALGESADPSNIPQWNAQTGELWFDGEIVRHIRNQKKATNIVRILAAFQESGWPRSIDDPVTAGGDSAQRRRAIESLNDGLIRIRFACAGDGESFTWEPLPPQKRKAAKKKAARKKRP